jgi:hypothetical protein
LKCSKILMALLTTVKAWALPLLPFDSAKFGDPSWMSGRHSGVSVELWIRMARREVTALPPLLLWWASIGGDIIPLFYHTHLLVLGLQIIELRFFTPYFSQIFLNVYFFVLWELPNTEIKIRCLFHPRSLLFSFRGRPAGCVQTRNSHY